MMDYVVSFLEKLTERTPPVFAIVWILLGIAIGLIIVLPMWLIGFWMCERCHKISWMSYSRRHKEYHYSDTSYYCSSCKEEKEALCLGGDEQ